MCSRLHVVLVLVCFAGQSLAWSQNSCYVRQSCCSNTGIEKELANIGETLKVIADRLAEPTTPPTEPVTTVMTPEPTTEPSPEPTTEPSPPLGSFENPASSCGDIPQESLPGEYWIQPDSNPPVQVYCDTNRASCSCDNTVGWMRVANIDMTDPNQQCPSGLQLTTRTEPPFRTCGHGGISNGCASTTIPVHGVEYSRVCGRIVGYQVGSPDAFAFYRVGQDIDGYYLYGFSFTHGQSPRQHIWSFVGAVGEGHNSNDNICPCTRNDDADLDPPPFIGSDYFCDTALRDDNWQSNTFYPSDPLWDGQGCGGTSTCCEFNNPPWFCKQLPQPTTDDIEMRICNGNGGDDTPFEVLEMFVK